MSGANSCAVKQATPTPRPQDMCSDAPREEFILFSTDIPVAHMIFWYEADAQRAAESIVRSNRGVHVGIAKVIAAVIEPLPALEWTDGRPAGSGQLRGGGLDQGLQMAETLREHYRR